MKRTKNQVSKEASLRSEPLPCSSGKTTGCNTFAPVVAQCPSLQQKLANALPDALAHQFYLPSPEAFLLTLVYKTTFCNQTKEARKG